jgi:hypothetical protein
MAAAMRNAHKDVADAKLLDDVARATPKRDRRSAARVVADFDIAPTDAAAPAGADCLEDCFLGSPAPGEVLRGLLAASAVFNLSGGVNAVDEKLAVPLDHLGDPQALDDIGSDAQYIHKFMIIFRGAGQPKALSCGCPTELYGDGNMPLTTMLPRQWLQ